MSRTAKPNKTDRDPSTRRRAKREVRPANTLQPEPPPTYEAFVSRYPKLADAWELVHQAGQEGPLDERTVKLVKLAIAMGALREGAVHSAVRKARAAGIEEDAIKQMVALATSTLGFPATVAVFSWIERKPPLRVARNDLRSSRG